MPPVAGQPKSKAYTNPVPAQSDEVKYRTKCKQLKHKIADIEKDNLILQQRIDKSKRNILRLRLERSILYELLLQSKTSAASRLDPHLHPREPSHPLPDRAHPHHHRPHHHHQPVPVPAPAPVPSSSSSHIHHHHPHHHHHVMQTNGVPHPLHQAGEGSISPGSEMEVDRRMSVGGEVDRRMSVGGGSHHREQQSEMIPTVLRPVERSDMARSPSVL